MLTDDPKHDVCDSDWIARFLRDQLTAEQVATFENHLEECAACRCKLSACAADEGWWSRARDCLAQTSNVGRPSRPSEARDGLEGRPTDMSDSGSGSVLAAHAETHATLAAVKPYLAPTDDPRMMGRVGPYEIVGLIGSGGNGVVLKGFDAALHRYVAIKLLSPRLADSGGARRRFSREAQAAAAVVHENVMAIHAVAETQGLPYLVMPYARGPSLERRLRSGGPLSLEEILRVGMQVAAGLSAAHTQGLVHRDIKPANILLEEGVARVKITDFGLARAADDASLTRSGVIAGTPQYMSPEQARGEPVDQRTDLFSLGSVLYAACTGRSPFRAETSYGVLRRICESEAGSLREVNSAIPGWLERLVARMLAKDPADRFTSAAEVAALLERCLAHVQQPALVQIPDELADSPPGLLRSVGSRGMIAVAILLVVAGSAAIAWRAFPPASRHRASDDAVRLLDHESRAAQRGSGSADSAAAVGGSVWQDGISEKLETLETEIEKLRTERSDDSWNDAIELELDELERDVNALQKEMGNPAS